MAVVVGKLPYAAATPVWNSTAAPLAKEPPMDEARKKGESEKENWKQKKKVLGGLSGKDARRTDDGCPGAPSRARCSIIISAGSRSPQILQRHPEQRFIIPRSRAKILPTLKQRSPRPLSDLAGWTAETLAVRRRGRLLHERWHGSGLRP